MIGTASILIPRPAAGPQLRKETYRTTDIVDVVQDLVNGYAHETEQFAKQFSRDKAGLKRLFNWVYRNFRYQEDPAGAQLVQTPAHLNHTRVGDCKSFTIFISSVLQNMGIDHKIRYAGYGTRDYRHVYPVAVLNKREIPLDVVWKVQEGGHFAGEKPYTKKKDYNVQGLFQLGSTSSADMFSQIGGIDWNQPEDVILGQLERAIPLSEIEATAASMPAVDPRNDVTKMTMGETERMIWEDRMRILSNLSKNSAQTAQYTDAARAIRQGSLAGIGSLANNPLGQQVEDILKKTRRMNQPAFPPFTIDIPTPPQVGFFKKIGNFFKKVGKAVGDVFKGLVNWVFKGMGKAMGPFFIYRFLKRNVIKSKNIKGRLAQQDKSYRFIQKIGKFDDSQLQGLMLNGILEKTGKTPEQFAREGGVPQIGAFPAIIAAISSVIQVITKIASVFKKKGTDAGIVDQSTMSDPSLFEEEARLHAQAAGGGGGGGFNPLYLLPLLAVPILMKK